MSIQWDYMVRNVPKDMASAQNKFKEWGKEGWELVSIIHHSHASDFFKARDSEYFAFFKKQLQEENTKGEEG